MMRVLADENCDRLIVTVLRAAGHDVTSIAEADRGVDDMAVWLKAQSEGRVLLTDDLDFGRLFERERVAAPTVFLMRIGPVGRRARAARVLGVLDGYDGPLTGQLVVIETNQIRCRSFK